jgi:hypothetical protein
VHPLMLGLFLVFSGLTHTQAYQIIPALLLLPTMCILEYIKYPTRIKNA